LICFPLGRFFTKLANYRHRYVQICCTEFHQIRKIDGESADRNAFTPCSTIWLHYIILHRIFPKQKSHVLFSLSWRMSILHFVKIRLTFSSLTLIHGRRDGRMWPPPQVLFSYFVKNGSLYETEYSCMELLRTKISNKAVMEVHVDWQVLSGWTEMNSCILCSWYRAS